MDRRPLARATISLAVFAILVAIAGCGVAIDGKPGRHVPEANLVRPPVELGLAARYPADRRIKSDPAVLIADDVESASEGLSPWDRVFGGVRITDVAENVHSGRRALELSISDPAAIGIGKQFSEGFDRLFLRYYLKYDDAFPGAHHVGGLLYARAPGVPETLPGVKPDGTNKFDVVLDHSPVQPPMPPPGHLVAYVYHMDQQHQWGEQFYPSGKTSPGINAARGIFGPSFVPRNDFVPTRGRWHCYELMAQANTPARRDGRVAFWFDGRLAADFPNLRFRTTDALKINHVAIAMYESQRKLPERIWIDDVVVATQYIGPMTEQ